MRAEQVLLDLIAAGEPFAATSEDGAISVRVDRWEPCVGAAIHDGHLLRDELAARCALDADERRYEEDPHTADLIAALPVTIVCHDSRYEYDLNRPLAQAVYTVAWGKRVWSRPPTERQRARSHAKHQAFYRVLDALIAAVETRCGACLVFDVHSYNVLRHGDAAPVFNLGTSQIDMPRYGRLVESFRSRLAAITLPNVPVQAHCDTVFQGRGYLIAHINARHTRTLVIPTEVGKVFMDERTGELYPLVMAELATGFKHALSETAAEFARRHARRPRARRHDMLTHGLDPALVDVDRQLHALARGVETLVHVSPINVAQARRAFLRRGTPPRFAYRPLAIDPYAFRARLYRLPVERIADPEVQQLYHAVIDGLAARIDLLTSVGTERFVYNSLRTYGEPDAQDLANARFILHGLDDAPPDEPVHDAAAMQERLRALAHEWGMECRVERSRRIVARAMVNNSRRALVINTDARASEVELQALAHHELGIHMATTLNAAAQPLKIFRLGLPRNTLTQEGLAILNEYLTGNLTLARLKGLALRVVAIDLMLRQYDFADTVQTLRERYGQPREAAFDLAVRVYRGGGFTKDYLYLRGLREAYASWRERSLENLMIGKTSLPWLPLIEEMRARGLVVAPRFLPRAFTEPVAPEPVVEYVVRSIQPARRS
jgi:uncharacterized protein (TIGR02421 family)